MSHGVAQVNPSVGECQRCMDTSEIFNDMPNCNNCPRVQTVEILQFSKSFWKSTVICKTSDGSFIEVDIKRLRTDIKI